MTTFTRITSGTLIRISLGVVFVAHGLLKLLVFGLPGTVAFFASTGLPGWLAYPVAFGEVIGGGLLLFGLFIRPITAAMVPVLLGATWVHFGNGWVFSNANGGWEFPLFLTVITIAVFLQGQEKLDLSLQRQTS